MPRLRPSIFHQARAISSSLLRLLPTCRDLPSARNELRWLEDHARYVSKQLNHRNHRKLLHEFVLRRSHGEPLQYILQSEFFGDLEIKCRPGVLIPRQETAASVSHLVRILCQSRDHAYLAEPPAKLRVLDLCTGSGCIPLLFHHEFYQQPSTDQVALELVGVDISTSALSLARENLIHQIAQQAETNSIKLPKTKSLHGIGFVHADVLDTSDGSDSEHHPTVRQALRRLTSDDSDGKYDILIANPPYISPTGFQRTTSRSVQRYEPKLALVPSRPSSEPDTAVGDYFYPHLLRIAEQVGAKTALFEVADMEQAKRVATMADEQGIWHVIEIWRDEPAAVSAVPETFAVHGNRVGIIGAGHGRSVFLSRWVAHAL